MLDWFSGIVGVGASRLATDKVLVVSSDGEIKAEYDRWLSVGTDFGNLQIRRGGATLEMARAANGNRSLHRYPTGALLQMSGNPTKWLQGHNVAGPPVATLGPVLQEVCHRFHSSYGIEKPEQLPAIHRSRVDIAVMIRMDTQADVMDWLHAAALQTRSRHGTALMRGEGVYWGSRKSRRWQMKAYSKLIDVERSESELKARFSEPAYENLRSYVNGLLRIELTLRTKELKPKGTLTEDVIWDYWKRIEVGDMPNKTEPLPGVLGRAAENTYLHWLAGRDMRGRLPKATWYRHRLEIKKALGVDISTTYDEEAGKRRISSREFSPDWLKARQEPERPSDVEGLLFKELPKQDFPF